MDPMPVSTPVEMLIPIWQKVLHLPSVGCDENFFDLGGDSALALELFNEIALVCGREMPPVMIYHAPTISALAAVLEQPAASRLPAVVQLRPGAGETPVFIAHGLGGSAIDFYQVVKHIDTPHAIYGLQAKGIDGVEEPPDRIEDMARYSLDAVRQLQPHGPYLLIGFSLGGLVALEMAQQLLADGEAIGLLAMLDSYPHSSYLSPLQRTLLATLQARRWIASRLQWLGVRPPYRTVVEVSASPALQRFRESNERALRRYQPKYYPGTINFVRAAIPTDYPANPAAVWSKLVRQFQLQTVPGDHLGMMTLQFESLASAISRSLKDSSSATNAQPLNR